jgi:sortase A
MSLQIKARMLPARAHWLVSWSRRLFLAIGIAALGYCGFVLADAKLYQAYESRQFDEALKNVRLSRAGGEPLLAPALPPLLAEANRARDVAGSADVPLGRIEISSLGLAAMILEGTDERTLGRAVGHIPGSAMPGQPGNVAIAGHRDTFFRGLRNIRKNDEITVTTMQGASRYSVDSTEIVGPEDVRILDSSTDEILTLVTCYPFTFVGPAPGRFIVRAHRIPG